VWPEFPGVSKQSYNSVRTRYSLASRRDQSSHVEMPYDNPTTPRASATALLSTRAHQTCKAPSPFEATLSTPPHSRSVTVGLKARSIRSASSEAAIRADCSRRKLTSWRLIPVAASSPGRDADRPA